MKNVLLLLLVIMGCASSTKTTNLLTTNGEVYQKRMQKIPMNCAIINEWNVSTVRPDKQEKGCWCMAPPVIVPGFGATITFLLMKDEFCAEEKVQNAPLTESGEEHKL